MKFLFLLFIPLFIFAKTVFFEGGQMNLNDLTFVVSRETNKDIVLSSSLKDKIIYLRIGKRVSVSKLFNYYKAIIDANGLSLNKKNGFYIVSPVTDLKYFSYRFKYRNATVFKDHLSNFKNVCSLSKFVLFCSAPPKKIKTIKKMVKFFDIPKKKDPFLNKTVDINVKIIESNFNDLYTFKKGFNSSLKTKFLNYSSSADDSFSFLASLFLGGESVTNTLSFSYFLNFLQKNDISSIVNEPRILVTNNHSTSIITGGTTRVIKSVTKNDDLSTHTTSYQQMDIGLQISVGVKILSKNSVLLTIKLNNENIAGGTADLPVTSKQSYSTTLSIKKNEIIIIGGVIYNKKTKSLVKIPFLSDIPLIGEIFKNKSDIKEKKVLTIALSVKDIK